MLRTPAEAALLESGHQVRASGSPGCYDLQLWQARPPDVRRVQCTGTTYEHRVCRYQHLLLWNDTFFYVTTGTQDRQARAGCGSCLVPDVPSASWHRLTRPPAIAHHLWRSLAARAARL